MLYIPIKQRVTFYLILYTHISSHYIKFMLITNEIINGKLLVSNTKFDQIPMRHLTFENKIYSIRPALRVPVESDTYFKKKVFECVIYKYCSKCWDTLLIE